MKIREIYTNQPQTIRPFLKKLNLPDEKSHKGDNGRLLVIGGSSLFHAASIWSAEIAAKIVDIVHYNSTEENQQIFLNLKSKFTQGIVIKREDLNDYIAEDDCILAGPGMLRSDKKQPASTNTPPSFQQLLQIKDEPEYTRSLINYLSFTHPQKRFVFDGGAIQMMDSKWLRRLNNPAIVTPHTREYKRLFSQDLSSKSDEQMAQIVCKQAKSSQCVIVLKAVSVIISDGKDIFMVKGGNAGLTKGGTGDVLAGIIAALYCKNDPMLSSIIASYIVKKTADNLFRSKHFWYNTSDLIDKIPETFNNLNS